MGPIRLIVCLLALTTPALARDATPLHRLMHAYEARGWEAVGRVNIGSWGMCTGTLISDRVVLTAAHCLFDERTGAMVDPALVRFAAGWRNGRAVATRGVRRAVVHPDYDYTGPRTDMRVADDVAILELDAEIRLANVTPMSTGHRPRKGASVGVVSYAHDRRDTPSLQEVCHVLARRSGTLVLSCDVDFGSSGAPVFMERDGRPEIVSVVSAKGSIDGRRVSVGTGLEKQLAALRAILSAGGGVEAGRNRQARQTMRPRAGFGTPVSGGAKFVRP